MNIIIIVAHTLIRQKFDAKHIYQSIYLTVCTISKEAVLELAEKEELSADRERVTRGDISC